MDHFIKQLYLWLLCLPLLHLCCIKEFILGGFSVNDHSPNIRIVIGQVQRVSCSGGFLMKKYSPRLKLWWSNYRKWASVTPSWKLKLQVVINFGGSFHEKCTKYKKQENFWIFCLKLTKINAAFSFLWEIEIQNE